jgi:hypothetical protein
MTVSNTVGSETIQTFQYFANPPDSLMILHKHSLVYATPLAKLNTALTRQGLRAVYERGSLKRESVFVAVAVARQNKTTRRASGLCNHVTAR